MGPGGRTHTAAHASFSHAEHAIAAYLDDEGLGEDEDEDEGDPEDMGMQDANFTSCTTSANREMSEHET
jgi:hypothetical protein